MRLLPAATNVGNMMASAVLRPNRSAMGATTTGRLPPTLFMAKMKAAVTTEWTDGGHSSVSTGNSAANHVSAEKEKIVFLV